MKDLIPMSRHFFHETKGISRDLKREFGLIKFANFRIKERRTKTRSETGGIWEGERAKACKIMRRS